MAKYVYIIKSTIRNDYMLSSKPLEKVDADTYFPYWAIREKSVGNPENRIIELAMPEDKYITFRSQYDMRLSKKDIDAFLELNKQYKQAGLKFMPPATSFQDSAKQTFAAPTVL